MDEEKLIKSDPRLYAVYQVSSGKSKRKIKSEFKKKGIPDQEAGRIVRNAFEIWHRGRSHSK